MNRYVDQELRSYKVLGAAHIYKGALVGVQRSSGYVRPLQSGDGFAGIAYEEADNTSGSSGDKSVRVYTQGDFALAVTGATQASIGRPVFASADDTVALASTGGVALAGLCVDVPASNQAIVRIGPLGDSEKLQTAQALLTSQTGSATTNPVMITGRAIVVLSAEVVFNSKPDAGTLDVGTGNTTPNELVSGFNLTTLTNHARTVLTLAGSAVAKDTRIWAKVSAATSSAGVGGLLTLRYIELP
ncbi:MAG: hypothetical protein U1A27_04905 [Phycisphaerae bacterium]